MIYSDEQLNEAVKMAFLQRIRFVNLGNMYKIVITISQSFKRYSIMEADY